MAALQVVLLATYELGRQPFGLASPAAWLAREECRVCCVDLSLDELDSSSCATADLVAFHLPMHTATRLALRVLPRVRAMNPRAHICFYGLYAPLNEGLLRELGGETILGGEFETGLVSLVRRLRSGMRGSQTEPVVSLERQQFLTPDRSDLPELQRYARLQLASGERRTVGYTEASRGCKHLCRHCPVVPVYGGRFRIVQPETVLEDVRRQVARGAQHITFGDPDFLNGPRHAIGIVESIHEEFPGLTYDITVKIEHLLKHRRHLRPLRDTGCLLVTTAVESFDDQVLELLDKGHTHADVVEAVRLTQRAELHVNPTFVPFTPWQTPQGYVEFLRTVLELDLVDQVAPVQYAIRLLIMTGSRLLELRTVRQLVGQFDAQGLLHPWDHPDPRVDALQQSIFRTVHAAQHGEESRRATFRRVWELAVEASGASAARAIDISALDRHARATVPYLTEPWYC